VPWISDSFAIFVPFFIADSITLPAALFASFLALFILFCALSSASARFLSSLFCAHEKNGCLSKI
jgi:hypothetical protein